MSERRVFHVEMRVAGEGAAPRLEGYAAVFDQLSLLLFGQFKERIERGAFAASLASDDVRSLWNHNADFPLGRTKAGTLRLAEDAHGLRTEIDPPQTTMGRDAVESIRRGDVDQMSFAFDVLPNGDEWEQGPDELLIRTIKKVRLYEVSPVTFPAYPSTSIQARGVQELGDQPVIPERFRGGVAVGEAERAQGRSATRRRRLATIL